MPDRVYDQAHRSNSLTDPTLIDALYKASNAGVKIFLIVRGMCCLRPGIPKFSENISVKSIVGRFLEHARIFCFGNGDLLPSTTAKVFISSADWMPRNLVERCEVVFPVTQPDLKERLRDEILKAYLDDNVKARILQSDGEYIRAPRSGTPFSAQDYLMNMAEIAEEKIPARKLAGD